ncbi:MAG: hypothetical protein GWO07_06685 [Candidatus Dadabacteria bacterium]|nr:hypothetical protein [Candidatus Dadabacteria bacterium]NIS08438.1 hypothetical protein [Candidatus Dadabacteria bacterium]NIV42003.1 hypothetical protein [Candidatus Dadabacteria bacterium]NIY21926.1 hypothetical protein [Candidatus Dadabacteria bacterium]
MKELGSIEPILKEAAKFALSGSNVKCEFKVRENIPLLEIDKGQINQVIQNLIINADHAMPGGGVIGLIAEAVGEQNIKGSTLNAGNYVKITIEDKGTGIPDELIGKIFDPFFTTK